MLCSLSFRQWRIVARIAQVLFGVAFGVVYRQTGEVAVAVERGCINRIDKAFVGRNVEGSIARQHFVVQTAVNFHGVGLDNILSCRIVAGRFDALNFGQQFAKGFLHESVIVYHNKCFAVAGRCNR